MFRHLARSRPVLAIAVLVSCGFAAGAETLSPHLKVFICTGDFGMWAQDRVPMIKDAVQKAAPEAQVDWESHQSYNATRLLESSAFVRRFDVVVLADVGIGQLTSAAQRNLVAFVEAGGGLVWGLCGKATAPFQDSPDAVPMPLSDVLPVAYPDFATPHSDATVRPSSDKLFEGISWDGLTDPGARGALPKLAIERKIGRGMVVVLSGGTSKSVKRIRYATHEVLPGGWDQFPALGALWCRVLGRVAAGSPIRGTSRETVDGAFAMKPLRAKFVVTTAKQVDDIRAAVFSIVALQQLYNEDGGRNENLFLTLNPQDWFDRRSQEVLPNTKGAKTDKAVLFREYNIRGMYMGGNSYGSYGKWDDARYEKEIAGAIEAKKRWPAEIVYFQAGNEPPLNKGYIAFHRRFVSAVLAGAPGYQVVGPNKAFNLHGVNREEMDLYIGECGKTTDVLNWHTYAQPPSTVLAEALYWSDRAKGKMRTPGLAKVMFTESDTWNTGDSQFNYLMERAFTFLPEPTILANFQYCMDKRYEGGTYHFGVLQPEGEFAANYNGYWAWRNLRGRMVEASLTGAEDQDSLRGIAGISRDGRIVTAIVYFGMPVWRDDARYDTAKVDVEVALPPGQWKLTTSRVAWNNRQESEGGTASGNAKVSLELAPYKAAALTWTKK